MTYDVLPFTFILVNTVFRLDAGGDMEFCQTETAEKEASWSGRCNSKHCRYIVHMYVWQYVYDICQKTPNTCSSTASVHDYRTKSFIWRYAGPMLRPRRRTFEVKLAQLVTHRRHHLPKVLGGILWRHSGRRIGTFLLV